MKAKRKKAAVSTGTEATAQNYNKQNRNHTDSLCKSSGKLRENLAEQVTELLVYLHDPFLREPEYRQGLHLFENTLRKYLAVKHRGNC